VLLFVIWVVVSAVAAFLTLGTHVLLFCSVFSTFSCFVFLKYTDDDGVSRHPTQVKAPVLTPAPQAGNVCDKPIEIVTVVSIVVSTVGYCDMC